MEIWLIENGTKIGPLPDFEVRSRIRGGQLAREVKCWHVGMDEWTPLGELESFRSEFGDEDPSEEVLPPANTIAPEPGHLWRRFGARWFDWMVFRTLIIAVLLAARVDIEGLWRSGHLAFVILFPTIFFESLLLCLWGTTLGKWLTGLELRTREGGKLSAGKAIIRAIRVQLLGMGLGNPLLAIVFHGLSAWLLLKKKVVLWDSPAGHQLLLRDPQAGKWVAFGVGIALAAVLQLILLTPTLYEIQKDKLSPLERQKFESLLGREAAPKAGKSAATPAEQTQSSPAE